MSDTTVVMLWLFACAGFGAPPAAPMSPCPASPNCVTSMGADEAHSVHPFELRGPPDTAIARLATMLADYPQAKILEQTGTYLHAAFTSATLQFVDDVEFQVRDGKLHVRSASRLGHGDMGVNRNRIEELRAQWDSLHGGR